MTTYQAKIHGMMDAIIYKDRAELVADVAALAIVRLIHGENDDKHSGRGDASTLMRLDKTIKSDQVNSRSIFKRVWPVFIREVCGDFLELNSNGDIIGQIVEGAKAEASKTDNHNAPRHVAYYRSQFDRCVAELKAKDKADRKPPKTDAEKFIALAEKLGIDINQAKALLPREDIPQVADEIAA